VYFKRYLSVILGGLLAEHDGLLFFLHIDFTRFLAVCVMYSFYNGLRECDGFCMELSNSRL